MMNNKEKNSVIVRTHAFPGKKETRRHVRQLKRGRTKSLGPFESLQLRLIGLDDGRRGLPKEVGQYDGYEWSSAFIQKETDAWEEFCNRAWGLEQVALERYHVRASVRNTPRPRMNRITRPESAVRSCAPMRRSRQGAAGKWPSSLRRSARLPRPSRTSWRKSAGSWPTFTGILLKTRMIPE